MNTFRISCLGGFRPTPYLREFEIWGQIFVIHKLVAENIFRCSHKETGFSVSFCDKPTADECESSAKDFLCRKGIDAVLKAIESARETNAKMEKNGAKIFDCEEPDDEEKISIGITRADRLSLAGDCTRCQRFDLSACVYTTECRGCSRYYGDQFVERIAKTDKEISHV